MIRSANLNIAIVVGSGRAQGNTLAFAEDIADKIEAKVFNLANYNIEPITIKP